MSDFKRRDLVLRHQQKLHSSLPTNNRSKIPRKSLKLAMNTGKEGEIVSDYLNDNINIIRNNKNATLPLPGRKNENNEDFDNNNNNNNNNNTHNNLKSNLSSSSILTSSTASPNHNSSLPIDRSASISSTASSNQIYASPHSINSNSPNYVSPHNYSSRSASSD
ncbi:unnamed protein product [[Candida] boidinii]|nr:unnamed protein product [[Candida] boidinii]